MKKLLVIVILGAITLYLQGMTGAGDKKAAAASVLAQDAPQQAASDAAAAPAAQPQEIAIQVALQAPTEPAPAGAPGQWMWINGTWVDTHDMGGQACAIS